MCLLLIFGIIYVKIVVYMCKLLYFRAVLENTPDGSLPIRDILCHRNTGQHLAGGFCLQKCQVCAQTQVSAFKAIFHVITKTCPCNTQRFF